MINQSTGIVAGASAWTRRGCIEPREKATPMPPCPWYVSAHAVDRYAALLGRPVARGSAAWDAASDELIEQCALVWARYLKDPTLAPSVTKTGAYQYRGPRPLRISIVVSMARREEGATGQVVDVTSLETARNQRRKDRP